MVWEFSVPVVSAGGATPVFETIADFSPDSGIAHAPSIVGTPDGFSVFWFQGSKEAKPDVEIVSSNFFRGPGGGFIADPPAPLLRSDDLTEASSPAQKIIVLGNTIGKSGPGEGYYATVLSVGGWAMSGVMDVKTDGGKIVSARRLSLAPILGRSTLVRAPALKFLDGDTALPAYFEMGNAFSQLVRIGPDGRVRDIRRISEGRYAIQPAIVAFSTLDAVALMRGFDGNGQVYGSWTANGGNSWSLPEGLDLPGPDAPVAALLLSNGRLLVAYNNDPKLANRMDLAVSDDQGHSWQHVAMLEDHGDQRESKLRYPALARLESGEIVLAYSYGSKRGIRVHMFNEAWLDAQ